jgi:hypothetical protein
MHFTVIVARWLVLASVVAVTPAVRVYGEEGALAVDGALFNLSEEGLYLEAGVTLQSIRASDGNCALILRLHADGGSRGVLIHENGTIWSRSFLSPFAYGSNFGNRRLRTIPAVEVQAAWKILAPRSTGPAQEAYGERCLLLIAKQDGRITWTVLNRDQLDSEMQTAVQMIPR